MNGPLPGSVAVIVVNWNAWRLSLECLASLRAGVGAPWHLFLVDNASSDDSRAHLRDLGDDVSVILSDTNGGWTGGNNLGVRAALDAGFDRLFILNNDAQVRPDTIRKLCDHDADGARPAILGPVHLEGDGVTLDFIGATIDPATGMPQLMRAHETDIATLAPAYPTAYIRGAGLFATRRHFAEIGLFDDRYYLNYDETDWCFRARALGYEVLMLRDAQIVHVGSASIGGAMSPLNIYFIVRNGLFFAEHHGTSGQRIRQALALARWATTLPAERSKPKRVLAVAFGRSAQAIAARRGVRDYVLRRFGDCPPAIRTLSKSR